MQHKPAPAPWLWVWPPSDGTDADTLLDVGRVFRDYRETHHLSQAQLAELLGVDQTYVSKVEIGVRHIRDVGLLLQIARRLDIPPSRLGLSSELVESLRMRETTQDGPGHHDGADESDAVALVRASRDQWRLVRRNLNRHRAELSQLAAGLYEAGERLPRAPLLTRPDWLPFEPIELRDITLEWTPGLQRLPIDGTEPEAEVVCPLQMPGQRYDRYTSAVRYVDPPSLFENRPSYRLLKIAWRPLGKGRLRFGLATYFDKLDICEAVGHEFASAWLHSNVAGSRRHGHGAGQPVRWEQLPLRARIGDPFDLSQRAVIPAVTTLTLRRRPDGSAAFLLHWRDPGRVATAGGMYDVIPAGEFQPSSVATWDQANDFDLWRNVVREFSEELLGTPEHDGSRSTPIDYDSWPLYQTLDQAQTTGKLRAFCLGVGLDALTLAATILTAVVIDDDVFASAFAGLVPVNAEGLVVAAANEQRAAEGIPFTEANVNRLLDSEPMAPPGAACLELAWQHRATLLGLPVS